MIRVLQICGSNSKSGVGISAVSLSEALNLKNKIVSYVYFPCSKSIIFKKKIFKIKGNVFKSLINFSFGFSFKLFSIVLKRLFFQHKMHLFTLGFEGSGKINYFFLKKFDIFHFHWPADNISLLEFIFLKIFFPKKPIVISIRDQWFFTGGCHAGLALRCQKFKNSCGNCPIFKISFRYDLSWLAFKLKKLTFYLVKPYLISISESATYCLNASSISSSLKTIHISNHIKPFNNAKEVDLNKIKRSYKTKKILIVTPYDRPWKGIDLAIDSLNIVYEDKKCIDFEVSIIGAKKRNTKFNSVFYDFIPRSDLLKFYDETTFLIYPSLYESFGKIIVEAMSLAVPVIAFNLPAMNEIISNGKDGILSEATTGLSLSKSIKLFLRFSEDEYIKLAKNAFEKSKIYSINFSVDQHLKFYENLFKKSKNI